MKKHTALARTSALLVVLSLLTVMLTGCSKTAVTTAQFTELAKSKNFIVEDAADQFAAYDEIKEVTITAPQSLEYQIEFYVLASEANAKSFFTNNQKNFEMNKSGQFKTSSINGKNYNIFKLEANNKFMMLERVDNTVIYVNTASKDKKAVEEFIKELKY